MSKAPAPSSAGEWGWSWDHLFLPCSGIKFLNPELKSTSALESPCRVCVFVLCFCCSCEPQSRLPTHQELLPQPPHRELELTLWDFTRTLSSKMYFTQPGLCYWFLPPNLSVFWTCVCPSPPQIYCAGGLRLKWSAQCYFFFPLETLPQVVTNSTCSFWLQN